MTRNQLANRLLRSLIPLGALTLLVTIVGMVAWFGTDDPLGYDEDLVSETGWEIFWDVAATILWIVFLGVLTAGVVVKILARRKERQIQEDAMRYSQLRNWQPISSTSWRNYRRNNVVMSVDRVYKGEFYVLLIDQDGESMPTEGFETPLYALQFGDFLWDNVLSNRTRIEVSEVQETRAQWDRTRMLGPGRSVAPQGEPAGSVMRGQSPVDDRITCPSCKRNLPGHARFCTFCGSSV